MKQLLVILVLVAACAAPVQEEHMMEGMPCHQMGDGSWMGDCDNNEQGVAALPTTAASKPAIIDVTNGDTITIEATPVVKSIRGVPVAMMGYNGMIPGPILRGEQGAEVTVNFVNNIDESTTVHWHGLRHDNKDDGVPGSTQEAVQPGSSFIYTVKFPDSGIFWYHPHVREDRQQDLGLAGNMLVVLDGEPDKEEFLMLDDILLGSNGIVPHGEEHANHALMGRYGNVLLVNGEEEYSLEARPGEIVRVYITNVANVRPFNISIPGAKVKLIGSDIGFYEQEEFVDSVVISPAERYIIEVQFPTEGVYELLHTTPSGRKVLGKVTVVGEMQQRNFVTKTHAAVSEDIAQFAEHFDRAPDYTVELDVNMPMMGGMHSMDDMPCHQMPDGSWMGDCDDEEHTNIEWEDNMRMMNSMSTTEQVSWIIRDVSSGQENMKFTMNAKVGDVLKVRLVNKENSMHPMQHPFHIHGQRFVVTHIDGVPVENKVWKDTVLVPIGATVDIVVDITNPGEWMMHCHIAEHLEAGMMSKLVVEE